MSKTQPKPLVQVIATARGYDGSQIREPGDVFMVPAALVEEHPRFVRNRDGVTVQDGVYPPCSWLEEAEVVEEKVTKAVPKITKKTGEDLT